MIAFALAAMRGLSPRAWLIGLAVAGVLAIVGMTYLKGRDDATASLTGAQKDKTIEIYRDRAKVNDETNSADDVALCLALGGVFNHAENKCM